MVVWAAFHPHDYTTIISFGRQHISFWKLFWDVVDTGVAASTSIQQTGRLLRDKQSGAFDVRFTSYMLFADFLSLFYCFTCVIRISIRNITRAPSVIYD